MLAGVIFSCKVTSVMTLDGVTLLYAWKTLQIRVNVCDTVKLLAGIIQCNGGKFREAQDFKCVFNVYCVLESKWISSIA